MKSMYLSLDGMTLFGNLDNTTNEKDSSAPIKIIIKTQIESKKPLYLKATTDPDKNLIGVQFVNVVASPTDLNQKLFEFICQYEAEAKAKEPIGEELIRTYYAFEEEGNTADTTTEFIDGFKEEFVDCFRNLLSRDLDHDQIEILLMAYIETCLDYPKYHQVLKTMRDLIFGEDFNISEKVELLKALGSINNPKNQNYRTAILRKMLFSFSLHIRNAAVIGLSLISDPLARQDLEKALEIEKAPLLKMLMKQVLTELPK